jgi:hypothetical protein
VKKYDYLAKMPPMWHERPRGTSKKRVSRIANAADSLDGFGLGCEIDVITFGQFSLIDAVDAILDMTGPADVVIATWAAAQFDMSQIQAQLTGHRITNLQIILDASMVNRYPDFCATLEERFGKDCLRTTQTHMKFVLIRTEKYKVVIRTSMNLNYNPRLEYIQVAEDAELYDFFAAVVEAVFEAEKPGLESRRQLVPRVPGAAEISPTTPVAMGEPPSLGYPPRRGMKQAKKLGAIEYVAGKNTR